MVPSTSRDYCESKKELIMAHHHQHTSPPRGCWGGRSREHPLPTQIHCFSSPASVTTPGKWTLNLGSCLCLYLLHAGIIKNDLVIMQQSSAVCNIGGHQVLISRENGGEGRMEEARTRGKGKGGRGEERKRWRKGKRKRWRKGPRALQRKSPFPGEGAGQWHCLLGEEVGQGLMGNGR